MRRLIIAALAVGLLIPAAALAGSAANPASNVGKENFGFSFEIENQVKNLGSDQTTSKRWLGKVIWGVTDRLDAYAKLGASDLKVAVVDAPDYRGKRGMTWGGGVRYLVAEVPKPTLKAYADVQALSFFTNGTLRKDFGEGYSEKYVDRYKWDEIQGSFFVVWQRVIFAPYGGFAISKAFGRVNKDVYRSSGGVEDFVQHEAYNFSGDSVAEMVMGIDFQLGGSGVLSGELRYSDDQDFSFSLGASELWHVK